MCFPIDTYGVKGCVRLFKEHGVEMFYTSGASAATSFHKVAEDRDVDVGVCAWFAFNTCKNEIHFLDEA